MSPAKDEGSSCHKGKEIATNDPPAKIVGEEAPFSKEEEEGCDLNDKCPLLIDPWYDTNIYFLVVPGDYLPLPPGHVWLSICCHDTEVSWVLLASSINDLDIRQGTSLPMPILFEFRLERVGR